MSLAPSVKPWVWERSPREKSLETLQVAKSEAMDAAPFSGDDPVVQAAGWRRNRWKCEFAIQFATQAGTIWLPCIATPVAFTRAPGRRCYSKHITTTPFYLRFSRGRRLTALVPLMEVRSPFTGRRGVCLPFSDTCEPLIFDRDAVDLVRDRVVRFAQERRWKHLEIRGGKFFQPVSSSAATFYGHTLDLRRHVDELSERFDSPVRRAIRKAERSNVSVLVSPQSPGSWRFLSAPCSNAQAARSSATADLLFPEHLRAHHQTRTGLHRSRTTRLTPNCRCGLFSLREERFLQVCCFRQTASGIPRK